MDVEVIVPAPCFSARVERNKRGRSEPADAEPQHRHGPRRGELEGSSQDGGRQVGWSSPGLVT